ncbi:MAG: HNH endonuclease [Endomicrobiaceae bacterium]|nr:HNH endonuclease [Endomicrobiaceae bacterium]
MGYKALKVSGKRIDEHRYIMENYLGRKLNSDEVVHHINGDKSDNSINNLCVMSKSEHASLHATNKAMTDDAKQKLRDYRLGRKPSMHLKLSDSDVIDIRKLLNNGVGVRELGRRYNIAHCVISDIKNNKEYTWVNDYGEDMV